MLYYMSVTPFPDPRTTNFIPEAWQYIDLWNKFSIYLVTYPKAQNFTINFLDPVFLTTRTALTQLADTAFATSEIVAWITANVNFGTAFTSAVLQYYFGGIRVATINPLTAGATLAIGNGATTNVSIMSASNTGILTLGSSGSTTRLNAPLTPLYDYPIGTATGLDTPSIGTAGTIGFIPETTFITNTAREGSTGSGGSLRSTVLTAGTWALYGYVQYSALGQLNTPAFTIVFTTVLNGTNGAFEVGRKGIQQGNNSALAPNMFIGLSTCGFATPTATTTYYLNVRSLFVNYDTQKSIFIAVRIS